MIKRGVVVLVCLVAMGLSSTALAQKVGPEFQVNTYTTGTQYLPSVASDASGNFVVVWNGDDQDGSDYGVFGQRYDSEGVPFGGEFQVNTYTTFRQANAFVGSDARGNFVVVWTSREDGIRDDIAGQRYDSSGVPLGGEFKVNTYTTRGQYRPSVAADLTGNFVVVWESYGQDGSGFGVFGQRYDSNGNALGDEFRANTYTTSFQGNASVASDGLGGFVVVWDSSGQDGSDHGIFAQRYESNGDPVGGEFKVNTYTTNYQGNPSVASDTSGNFVVVWDGVGQDGSSYGVSAQRYDSNGSPLGAEVQVNTYTTSSQGQPAIASDVSGNFVVVWQSYLGPRLWEIFGQRYDNSGVPQGGEFHINTYTAGEQRRPSVASDASGNAVVAWDSFGQDGSAFGVFGQRLSAGCGRTSSWKRRSTCP